MKKLWPCMREQLGTDGFALGEEISDMGELVWRHPSVVLLPSCACVAARGHQVVVGRRDGLSCNSEVFK